MSRDVEQLDRLNPVTKDICNGRDQNIYSHEYDNTLVGCLSIHSIMKYILGITCWVQIFVLCYACMVINSFQITHSTRGTLLVHKSTSQSQGKYWESPTFPKSQLDEWWKQREHLITIGSAGIAPTHLTSIQQLLSHHGRIKIKVASDKSDIFSIANHIIENELFHGSIELLSVRGKKFLVGQKE